MLTATALSRDGHGWPISSSLAPVRLPAALPTPLWLCATVPADPPAPVPADLTAPTLAQADAPTRTDAPARPRGFILQEIPHLEAPWRRTGQTPILRASRQTSIPALELPAGLHMLLTLNGQKLRLLRPGLNVFTPELLLLPGDRLRFEFYPVDRSPRGGTPLSVTAIHGQLPTEADILRAAFGDETPATPPARAVPFANLTRFQRQQQGLLGRLISSLTEGGRP